MSTRISSSKLSFGDQATGKADSVVLHFGEKCDIATLPEQIVVIGQSVPSFINSLPSEHEFQSVLKNLSPAGGSEAKGYSGSTLTLISGQKTRVHVAAVPSEASRHNNPYRSEAVTKSLMGLLPDAISEAAKNPSHSVSVIFALPSLAAIGSASFALARALPRFTRKTDRGKDADASKPVVALNVSFHLESGESISAEHLRNVSLVADSIRMSQTLTDAPPNELNVTTYLDFVRSVVADLPVEVKVIRGRELEEQGFGGLWNVGKGNTTNPPALVVLSHKGSKIGDSVVLVGKGIVYDSGGLAIKSREGMVGMKTDMSGSAAMFSAFVALVRMGGLASGEPLHCVLCLAENSIGPDSFRNDDVLRLYSGLTVEINNTDAEGRLVLADGCAYAAKHLKPRLVVDMATLTGAQGVATGVYHGAALCAEEADEIAMVAAGKRSGDLVFPILFCPEFHRLNYKSEIADMKNSVSNRTDAVSSASGWFVYDHMNAAGYTGNWVHVDMAYPATFSGTGKGTGYGVALVCSLLSNV